MREVVRVAAELLTAPRARASLLYTALGIASIASVLAGLTFGSFSISVGHVLGSLMSPAPGVVHDIVWNLRAPRAFGAFACGGLLALASTLLQVLLRNALADPYVLGVSGGASLGALLALVLGAGAVTMNASAFAGAVGVVPLQLCIFAAAALATVTAVVLGGAIGFVGLMAPHAIRLTGVAHHRALLPLAVLLGGSLLTIADTAARTIWAPQQLPVGIITALLGVPAMLLLLQRQR